MTIHYAESLRCAFRAEHSVFGLQQLAYDTLVEAARIDNTNAERVVHPNTQGDAESDQFAWKRMDRALAGNTAPRGRLLVGPISASCARATVEICNSCGICRDDCINHLRLFGYDNRGARTKGTVFGHTRSLWRHISRRVQRRNAWRRVLGNRREPGEHNIVLRQKRDNPGAYYI